MDDMVSKSSLDESLRDNRVPKGEKCEEVQRALENALLSVGLSQLTVSGERGEQCKLEEEELGVMKEMDGSCMEKSQHEQSKQVDVVAIHSTNITVDECTADRVDQLLTPEDDETKCGTKCGQISEEVFQVEAQSLDKAELEKLKAVGGAFTEWVDVTSVFSCAVELLAPGELIRECNFSLLDAMSAIELLDPKMDASVHWSNFKGYPRTVDEAVAKGMLQLKDHSPPQIIGIVDEVLACIVTWLNGHTLAQTVFSSLYLLDTSQVEDVCLRSYSLAAVRTVEYMRECIYCAGVCIEDDQQGVCFGFNMLKKVEDADVFASLKESEEKVMLLARQSAHADRQKDRGKKTVSSETEQLKALLHRVRFAKNLFSLMSSLRRCPSNGIQAVTEYLTQCLALLPDILSSCPLGEQLDSTDPLKLGFHPLINHNLLPPSYKPCKIMSREEAVHNLQSVLKQLEEVLEFGKLDSFRVLHTMSRSFCGQEQTPSVLARSVLVLSCMQSDRSKLFGSPLLEQMLKRDAREFCNPPSLNSRSPVFSSSQGKELTDRFFGQTIHPMSELLRLYCQHRARQQEKIERVLDYFADLQHETERIDQLHSELAMRTDPARQHLACYSSWVLYHTLCLMIDYTVLGFEYNLYSPFEYHYVFWYLEYLYGWLHTTWKSVNRLNQEPLPPTKGGKKKGKKVKKDALEKREREVLVVYIKRVVCVGMMRAFEALILDHKIPMPSFEYGSESLCFQHRFAAFACIPSPQPLTYNDYTKLAGIHNYKGMDINLYEAASRHFSTAKTSLETITHPNDELVGLLKALKTNIVIMNLAAKGHKRETKTMPTLDYSLHKHFPVIRIN